MNPGGGGREAEQPTGGGFDGTFIEVEVTGEAATDPAIAKKLEEVCPVDIFRDAGGKTEIVRENLDECVLCELCLEAAPAGTVVVHKLYDGTELRR
jgi:NAD-dependent dihydropyrimidine dehydrogenase PreA subunit